MKICKLEKMSQSGFGLVELIISVLLVGFLGLAVSNLGVKMFQMQRSTILTSETNEFSSSLGYYIKQSCHKEFSGRIFPPDNGDEEELVIQNYEGYGDAVTTDIKSGTQFDDKWVVTDLKWRRKTSIPEQEYRRENWLWLPLSYNRRWCTRRISTKLSVRRLIT